MSDKLDKSEEELVEELWNFPCDFLFKAMAVSDKNAEDDIVMVIQRHAPGDYTPNIKPSKKGNYISVSVTFMATSKQQLDNVYMEVNALEHVKFCL